MSITTLIPIVVEKNGVHYLEFSNGSRCELPNKTAGLMAAHGWLLYEAMADLLITTAEGGGEMPCDPELKRRTRERCRNLMDGITTQARADKASRPLPGHLGVNGHYFQGGDHAA